MENEIGLKLFFWLGTVILFASVLSVVIIVLLHRNKLFRMKKEESEKLLKISLASEKRERKRIASDLHDGISGDLNAVQNYITILQQHKNNGDTAPLLKEIGTIVTNTLENIQGISYNLMPSMLETQGLIATLESYFYRIRKWNHLSVSEYYNMSSIEIPAADSYELYRIIQELVTNVTKHGNADHISLSINRISESVLIELTDNGKRYDFFENLKNPSGMGLKNITSRVAQIKAKLKQIPGETGNTIQIYYYDTDRHSR
ncbi:sensor histidine kinase [Pedobacter sp. GR22-10]|uniref:sensor histidine kinase n=1 Tax=Pedobacter sp. GR22-10 TaxID=2994472 RepID=UPI002247A0FE|nr:ATP-binding protein [Pedobacter sp. GR22-10]MCX2429581.1 histidine kinase [Pedobacter sp. GR22-10]